MNKSSVNISKGRGAKALIALCNRRNEDCNVLANRVGQFFILILKNILTFAVRQSHICAANSKQFIRNNDKGVVSLNSICSANGGCRKPERATLFLFTVIVLLPMRQPVENNCEQENNSIHFATPIRCDNRKKSGEHLSAIKIHLQFLFPDVKKLKVRKYYNNGCVSAFGSIGKRRIHVRSNSTEKIIQLFTEQHSNRCCFS